MKYNHVKDAEAYAKGVVNGEIPACKLTKMACERHLNDLKKSKKADFPYKFDPIRAEDPIDFIELLPHVKGKWARPSPHTGAAERLLLEPWQKFIIASVFGWVKKSNGNRRYQKARIYVPRKNGKALDISTPIPTPEGWKKMGDIKIGDHVYHPSGKPTKVIQATEVLNERECYEVFFSNGESVIADADHQWLTTARVNMPGVKKGRDIGGAIKRVRTTLELFETQTYGKRGDRNHSMDMPNPIECKEKPLPIDPYVLGAWLGDGHARNGNFTFDRNDCEIFDSIQAAGYKMRDVAISANGSKASTWTTSMGRGKYKGSLSSKLFDLGLKHNKHIPNIYLRSSIGQRTSLLQGLMDTDGTISKSGRVLSYTTISDELASGVSELLASLGIKHSVRKKEMSCNRERLGRFCNEIQFMAFRDQIKPFRLSRKLERMREVSQCKIAPRSKTVQISKVVKVESVPVRCIQVESPDGLFLFGRSMLPTHNSILAAGIGLYMLAADEEPGAEVYSGATSQKQAWEVFSPARQMCLGSPDLVEHFAVEVNAASLILDDNSKFLPVIGKPGDGSSPHCAIIDEYHEHSTTDLIDTMETGMGARDQPLSLVISTAGSDVSSPCRDDWKTCEKILEAADGFQDETTFCIIFSIDEGDQWDTEESLIKANPNWGISINDERILAELNSARQTARKQSAFRTKYLNQWVTAKEAYFNIVDWNNLKQERIKREDFKEYPCYLAGDLASKCDLVALMQMFCLPGNKFAVFGKYYLPESALDLPENQHYRTWHRQGFLDIAGDTVTDLDAFKKETLDLCRDYKVEEMPSDPNRAWGVFPDLVREGVPVVEYRNTVLMMSEPTKELDAMIRSGRIIHDGDPVLAWAISNVVAKVDAKDNVFPRKEGDKNKIDPAVALIFAIGRAMLKTDEPDGPVFAW